jgi:hypothetical protein
MELVNLNHVYPFNLYDQERLLLCWCPYLDLDNGVDRRISRCKLCGKLVRVLRIVDFHLNTCNCPRRTPDTCFFCPVCRQPIRDPGGNLHPCTYIAIMRAFAMHEKQKQATYMSRVVSLRATGARTD